MFKIGSVLLVDSGTTFTSVNDSVELRNLRKVEGTRLENADGNIVTEITTKGNSMLNGHKVLAYVSPDLTQKLFSTVDRCLRGATYSLSSQWLFIQCSTKPIYNPSQESYVPISNRSIFNLF